MPAERLPHFPHGRARRAPIESAANEGRRNNAPLHRPAGRDRPGTRRRAADPAAQRAGAGGNSFPGPARARSRICPRRRLHGRRCCRRAGRPGELRPRHQEGQRGPWAGQLSDAASPHDAVRDVRDQVPREAADLRGPPVDPPSHRQRERILGALLDPRQRVLRAQARASGSPEQGQSPGPGPGALRQGGRARLRPAQEGCGAGLRTLHGDAERGRDGRAARSRALRAWRASSRA